MKNDEVYEKVTNMMLEALSKGVVPWKCPWAREAMPRSMSTGKLYQGCNVLILGLTQQTVGYRSGYWGTYKQISSLGGQVKKGEKSSPAFYAGPARVKDKENPGELKKIWLYRMFSLFNAEQADGLPDKFYPEPLANAVHTEETAENVLRNWPDCPPIVHRGLSAHYEIRHDTVVMPERGNFGIHGDEAHSTSEYYATLFHEVGHSTGHPERLNRFSVDTPDRFGSEKYAKEELVAEMFSNMMLTFTDLQRPVENSAAYLATWIKRLQNDPKMVVQASSKASKAVEWVLQHTPELVEQTQEEPCLA